MLYYLCSMLCIFGFAENAANAATTPTPSVSVFSTSTDWEAVTGLRLREFRVQFGRDRTMGQIGTELYFLDAFPCYGQTDSVRAWVSPALNFDWDSNALMRITCLAIPKTVQFAYREAKRGAAQSTTRGILTCETGQDNGRIMIHLENCTRGPDWGDYGKE